MKILFLYKYIPDYDFDHYLHMDLARVMKNTEGIDLLGYGLNLEEGYPDLASVPYNKDLTLKEIKEKFDFNLIVICTKSRMFTKYNKYYTIEEMRDICWLPKDFNSFDVPKIVLEEDYHYEYSDEWYEEVGVSLVLQRHYSNVSRGNSKKRIKHLWHPFSVDTNVFKPNPNVIRKNKICTAASLSAGFYTHRIKVSNMLGKLKLGKNYQNDMKRGNYPLCLQSFVSHVNGSGKADITAAKIFEIPATGSILFTNESERYGLQYLFPKNCYCTYKEDYSNVVKKARMILNDKDYVKETTEKALDCILEKHTHKVRINEFKDIIKKEYNL